MRLPQKLSKLALGLILPAILVAALEIAVKRGMFPATLSAAPSEIVQTCYQLLTEGELLWHASLSMLRMLAGVTNGALLGLALGIAAALSSKLDNLISPTIGFLAPIPAIVWLPFAIMIFGTGELYKIFLPAFVTFLLVYVQTFQAIRVIPREYVELARLYEKSNLAMVTQILVPASMVSSLTGLRVALAISWIALFVVEYSSADQGLAGLGWFIADSREVGRIEEQFAGVLVLGVLGYSTDAFLAFWQRTQRAWSDTLGDSI